jgi:hypothetical protein
MSLPLTLPIATTTPSVHRLRRTVPHRYDSIWPHHFRVEPIEYRYDEAKAQR